MKLVETDQSVSSGSYNQIRGVELSGQKEALQLIAELAAIASGFFNPKPGVSIFQERHRQEIGHDALRLQGLLLEQLLDSKFSDQAPFTFLLVETPGSSTGSLSRHQAGFILKSALMTEKTASRN